MKQKSLLLVVLLLALTPVAYAFEYADVIDFFEMFTGGYTNFITGKSVDDPVCMSGDIDCDGILDSNDNCVDIPNPGQEDKDGDGVGDVCDNCEDVPNTRQRDRDFDDIGDLCDNCPLDPNPDQEDDDNNGLGNICDPGWTDTDGDGIGDTRDNCPSTVNPDQTDSDGDGLGDACDGCPLAVSDNDRDGYVSFDCRGNDCNDNDGLMNPGAPEHCENGKDDNCNGLTDGEDPICQSEHDWREKYLAYARGERGRDISKEPREEQPSQDGVVRANGPRNIEEMQDQLELVLSRMMTILNNVKAIIRYEGSPVELKQKLIPVQVNLEYNMQQIRDALENIEEGRYDQEQDFPNLANRVRDIVEGKDTWSIRLRDALELT